MALAVQAPRERQPYQHERGRPAVESARAQRRRRPVYRVAREWDAEGVRALRQHLGLTQEELSARLGMRQQTVSEWEVGKHRPRGASRTLLTTIAEQAGFSYAAHTAPEIAEGDGQLNADADWADGV
jgi:putative transcriptional regulator